MSVTRRYYGPGPHNLDIEALYRDGVRLVVVSAEPSVQLQSEPAVWEWTWVPGEAPASPSSPAAELLPTRAEVQAMIDEEIARTIAWVQARMRGERP